MWNKWSALLLGLLLTTALPQAVKAETVIEKVARTGVLSVGARLDMLPYAYINDQQELVGFSVDLTKLIRDEVQEELGRPVAIQVQVVDSQNDFFPDLQTGKIDIACSMQFTWERAKFADYSIPYSISGIRLLVKKDSSLTGLPGSLGGKRVGVVPGSLSQEVMKALQPQAVLVPLRGSEDGGNELGSGKIDAIAGDTLILGGNALRVNPTGDGFKLIPQESYARYGISCIVPKNNSTFLYLVNRAIVRMMQGYILGVPATVEMVDRWVGPNGMVPLPADQVRSYFQTVIMSHEQIPLPPSESKPAS